MNNILTNKLTPANSFFSNIKRGSSLAIAATLATLLTLFSSSVLANRPAVEDSSEVNTEITETASASQPDMRPDMMSEGQPESQHEPSAVEIMMQQETLQTTGDVVQLPATEIQPGETIKIKLLDFPRRGMTMDKVQNEYGQPVSVSDSVGQPPITSWTYNDRIVYFEYSTVLHVVAR